MRNISAKTDNVGDTLPASDFNANLRNELQNIVESADFTLDAEGGPDVNLNMLGQAVALYANAGRYYQDSGAANAYVLSRVGNLKSIPAYKDGVTVLFKAGNANTGASTINVDTLGVKNLTAEGGGALTGGEIGANYVIARYHSSGDRFELVFSALLQMPPIASGSAFRSPQVNEAGTGYELAGPLTAFKNKLINGNFDIWQRGVSFTDPNAELTADRWEYDAIASATGNATITRENFTLGQTDVPGEPQYYLRADQTTAAGAITDLLKQKIEGVRTFAGKTVALSFYAKANSTKAFTLQFVQNFGTGGSPSGSVNTNVSQFNITNSWAKYEFQVAIPSISGKTLGTNGDDFLSVALREVSNTIFALDIAQVQIEEGSVATAFEQRPISIEESLVERFGRWITVGFAGDATSSNAYGSTESINPPMRDTPSVTDSVDIATDGSFPNAANGDLTTLSKYGVICQRTASGTASNTEWLGRYFLAAEL
ncbi:MAG: hypothetical protein KAS32_28790 [Candidatus Peribacteraceae bacterium]|nr:hypothetical protein [Candidatus Peribacteraceae bacterium]